MGFCGFLLINFVLMSKHYGNLNYFNLPTTWLHFFLASYTLPAQKRQICQEEVKTIKTI